MFKKRKDGFAVRLFTAIASCLLILIIITGVISYISVYDEHIRTMHQQNLAMINRLNGWLMVKDEMVESSALAARSLNLSPEEIQVYLSNLEADRAEITVAALSFQDGRVYFGGRWMLPEVFHVAERQWFEAAVQNPGQVAVSNPFSCAVTDQFSFAVSRTVSNYDDSLGVIAITLPFDSVINYIRENDTHGHNDYGHFYLVVDRLGYIIYYDYSSHLSDEEDGGAYQNIQEVYDGRYGPMFNAVRDYGRYSFDGIVYLAIPLEMSEWYVIIGASTSHVVANTVPTIISLSAVALFILATFAGGLSMLNKLKISTDEEKKTHDMIRAYLNSSPFFIEVWNSDKQLINCNDSVVSFFGLKRTEDYLEQFFQLSLGIQPCGLTAKDKLYNLLDECFTHGESGAEWTHLTADGEEVPVDVKYIKLELEGQDVAVGYSYDLRRLRSETKRRIDAEKENIAKSRFLAQMSHEIRTPMNAVLGITEIELHKNTHSAETEEAFQRIYNSSRLLISIINDILDLSQIDAGKMKIVPAPYEMASLIADTVQLNMLYIGSKPINFNLILDENLPETLRGDELRIKQILNNILSNAFKYTEEGIVTLDIGVQKTYNDDQVILIMKISDTGQGLSEKQITKLFSTDYTRFNQEKNRDIQGSGLGLNIVHSLVKMMEGHIGVKSKEGEGSMFTVRLPQRAVGRAVLGKETAERLQNLEITKAYLQKMSQYQHELMPYGRVLVVDDVETNLYVMRGFLQHYKLEVDTVDGGVPAVMRIKEGQVYDIIFMDHMMPDMNGIDATKAIRERGYEHPIVALTANAILGASQMFLSNGFSDFISKPIDPAKLDECLMKFVYAKQPPEVIAAAKEEAKRHHTHEKKSLSPDLVKSFLIDANRSVAAISDVVKTLAKDPGGLKLYTTHVHGIKSALANVNRPEISALAADLEAAGRSGDIDFIRGKTAEFLKKLQSIVADFSDYTTDSNPPKAAAMSPANRSRAIGKLNALAAACEAYETQAAQDLVEELKALPLPPHVRAAIDDISTHILLSNDEEAAVLAKEISGRI